MEFCDVTVLLHGSRDRTVEKNGVSPAEIAILRHIHGDEGVVNIRSLGDRSRRHSDERSHLTTAYGEDLVAKLYPDTTKPFPLKLRSIGLAPSVMPQIPPQVIEPEEIEEEDGIDGGDGLDGFVPPVPLAVSDTAASAA